MARNIIFLACVLIMALDVAAAILGIEAGIAQSKAFKLGLAAVILLIVAHVIANLLGSCILVVSEQELDLAPSKQLAAASLVLSWPMLFAAFGLLIAGTLANSKSPKFCRMFTSRPLYIGGIMCLIHGLLLVMLLQLLLFKKQVLPDLGTSSLSFVPIVCDM